MTTRAKRSLVAPLHIRSVWSTRIESFKQWQSYLKDFRKSTQQCLRVPSPVKKCAHGSNSQERREALDHMWWTSTEPKLAVSLTSVTNKVNSFLVAYAVLVCGVQGEQNLRHFAKLRHRNLLNPLAEIAQVTNGEAGGYGRDVICSWKRLVSRTRVNSDGFRASAEAQKPCSGYRHHASGKLLEERHWFQYFS